MILIFYTHYYLDFRGLKNANTQIIIYIKQRAPCLKSDKNVSISYFAYAKYVELTNDAIE